MNPSGEAANATLVASQKYNKKIPLLRTESTILARAFPGSSGHQDDYPFPFTRVEVFDGYRNYPYRAIGKLFFANSKPCSASAVSSPNNNLIWTAGHCLTNNGEVASGVKFAPAYKDGNAPYGRWEACQLYVQRDWFYNSDWRYDLGAIKACPRSDGARLHDVVGSLPITFNAPRNHHWSAFGYPENSPFTGERLITAQSSHGHDDPKTDPVRPIGIGSDMTPGSSGGPWILNLTRNIAGSSRNVVNGVVSYSWPETDNAQYSPYHGDKAKTLRQRAIDDGA